MPDEKSVRLVASSEERGESEPTSVFDNLDSLRKAQALIVKRRVVTVNVEVGKPPNNVYFRVHPEWQLDQATIIRDREERVTYYVVPDMRQHFKLKPRLRLVTLAVVCLWPGSTLMIWPVPIVGMKTLKVWKSERRAFELAHTDWMQIVWDDGENDHKVEPAEGIHHEPLFPPDKTFEQLLKLAFEGRVIDNEEHPYVRQLRGLTD
jgi:hypothetical protein